MRIGRHGALGLERVRDARPSASRDHHAAYLRRLRRRQARRAEPRRVAVPAPRLQHRVADGRPHRDAGRLAHDDRRRRRRGQRAARRGATSTSWSTCCASTTSPTRAVGRPRPGADQGRRDRRDARRTIMQLVDVFRARVVDVAPESLIIEIDRHRGQDRRPARRAAARTASSRWCAPAASRWRAARARRRRAAADAGGRARPTDVSPYSV